MGSTKVDGDNRLFPLAFALVEKENINTWTWLISCLAPQVVRGRSPMCIISDRHSGIIRAVRDVFPRPHRHRFYIQHIIANQKKRYSVKDLNKMVWRCASAEIVAHYDHEIQILEEACPKAKAELTEDMIPEQWVLAYDGNMSFGKLTTNSSESVNSLLKRSRSLPVQALASAIFYRMNAWFVHRRDKAAHITTHLCPLIDAHLRTVVDDARHVHVVAYGDGIFQTGEHKVNIMLKECTCRSFQIYQVPCVHAIAVCGAIHYDFHQMNERLMCLHGEVLWCRKVQWYSHQVRRGLRVGQCPCVFRILWIGEMTTEDDICVVIVSNSVITNGLVKPRLLAVQRVLVRGLGVGNCRDGEAPPLLYDRDSREGERAIRHGETHSCSGPWMPGMHRAFPDSLPHWPMDADVAVYRGRGVWCTTRVRWLRPDKPLITALVERWRSEANTFHLANGEMTITLEDVAVLLGLRVDGDAVTGSTRGDWMELAGVFLGVELLPGSFQGSRLSLSWLRGQFSFCADNATELVIQQHACAYLLHLVGATIFSDGSYYGQPGTHPQTCSQ
ncbi:hypothetical protein H6P81_010249 [Aristolochia fimbriata]|uniref:SWIM-type domain-containing protein n=1 Tax=Aristolochia fimbriata TaxID=158543 RepID=A0AAV7EP16_ARIFI|nr:hypothetical protein H6P81_010249 [Aristolochia fimbriata]